MAILCCRECNREVSDSAKICPHCGIKKPGKKINKWNWKVIVPVLFFISIFGSILDPKKNDKPKVTPPECMVRMANGVLDDRECDLVELCKDRDFYAAKAANGDAEAYATLIDVQRWLLAYRTEDVTNVCAGTYGKVKSPAPLIAKPQSKECNREPFETFPVGEVFSSEKLSSLVDRVCPGAIWRQDEKIELFWNGRVYILSTTKLPYDGVTAKYKISSLKSN